MIYEQLPNGEVGLPILEAAVCIPPMWWVRLGVAWLFWEKMGPPAHWLLTPRCLQVPYPAARRKAGDPCPQFGTQVARAYGRQPLAGCPCQALAWVPA